MKVFTQASQRISKIKQELSLGRYYQRCDTLPFYNFIKLAVTGDLTWLKISGSVPQHTLKETWLKIQEEYTNISKDEEAAGRFELTKQIHELHGRIISIEYTVNALKRGVGDLSPEFIGLLRKQGFRYKYTAESLQRDLELTITQTKSLKIQLDTLQSEAKSNKSEPSTEQDYYEQLAILYPNGINPRIITVAEVVAKISIHKKLNTPSNGIDRED